MDAPAGAREATLMLGWPDFPLSPSPSPAAPHGGASFSFPGRSRGPRPTPACPWPLLTGSGLLFPPGAAAATAAATQETARA